ncbi:hypothetical protein [Butyrivibrio sp. AE3004]|uniref:hypothetical protein n=1 Tax=Butyrivibrio sp. AE3004 TaxID=1506994 RepID=UPI0004945BD3|nr:hypothetical protein [Butyrivibrio sp. AE3004]
MYYESRTTLTSHPDIEYDDGKINYFFYSGGKDNIPGDKAHSKSVSELIKYIVDGKLSSDSDSDLARLDEIVNSVKKKSEVTRAYMQEWDRQRIHDKELTEQVTAQVTEDAAIKCIRRLHILGVPESSIRESISEDYGYSSEQIEILMERALSKPQPIH